MKDEYVWVCAACRCASCWAGLFYCEKYKTADIVKVKKSELLAEDRDEHPCYLDLTEVQAEAPIV